MMGDVMQTIFGGKRSQSQSTSGNQAYPYLQGALSGTIGQGGQANTMLASLLGLGGGGAQDQGFANFRNSTGYQFGKDQGMQAITGGAATKGLLNSGGTLKALDAFGQDYASTKYGDYTNLLQSLMGAGLQGASVLGNAGNVSQSTSSSSEKPSLAAGIGQLIAK